MQFPGGKGSGYSLSGRMLKCRPDIPIHAEMTYPKIHNNIRKVFALVGASLVLPVLAYAHHDDGKGTKIDNDEHHWGDHDTDRHRHFPSVPDGGPGIVLLATTFGAVLLFSTRQLSRSKA